MKLSSCRTIVKAFLVFSILSIVVVTSLFARHVLQPWEDEVIVAIGEERGLAAEKRIPKTLERSQANH